MLKFASAKNKTLIFVTCLLLTFAGSMLYFVYADQMTKLQNLEKQQYLDIQTSFNKIIERHIDFYSNRAKANMNSAGIKDAMANLDRERLIQLSKGRWKTLSGENPFLKVMHFHAPNGTSLVRMHKQDMFGDNLADIRPMIASIHKNHKPLFGFESGIFFLAYRVIMPIFQNDKYIGALEFGSRPDLFLSEIKYYNNLNGALFIKNDSLSLYKEDNTLNIGDYSLQYDNIGDHEMMLALIEHGFNFQDFFHLHYDNKAINIYTFDLKNFNNKTVAKVVFSNDISGFEAEFYHSITRLIILLALLLTFILIIINYGFKKIISSLDDANKELNQNKRFLKLIMDNTAHGIIATEPDGTIMLVNKRAEAMLGYAESELKGKATLAIIHKESEIIERAQELSARFNKNIPPGLATFTAINYFSSENSSEWTYVSKDGYEFPVNLYVTPLEDENKHIIGYVGLAEDISLKKVLERNLIKQKNELEAILQTSRDGIAILDMQTNFLFLNDAYVDLTGYSIEELRNLSCLDLTLEEDREKSAAAVREIIETGIMENFEKRCVKKDGTVITVSMTFVLMPDKKRFLTTSRDVTETKKAAEQLQRYTDLVDKHTIAATADMNGCYIYVSEGMCNISGYSKEELLGKHHLTFKHPDVTKESMLAIKNQVTEKGSWAGEVKYMNKAGKTFWVYSQVSAMRDENGNQTGCTSISQDITDKKIIEQISITDGLTGIYNRRHFNDIFPKYINSAKRHNEYINFIIMDIDHFKQYNDTYGHQKGDEALTAVAKCIQNSIHRADDSCFRLGGEEFGVLYRTTDTDSAIVVAERIRENIMALKIPHKKNNDIGVLTVSIGLLIRKSENVHNTDEVYADADKLLYEAKNSGRNRVAYSIK